MSKLGSIVVDVGGKYVGLEEDVLSQLGCSVVVDVMVDSSTSVIINSVFKALLDLFQFFQPTHKRIF